MEWRFNPPEERWINVGYTVYDFQVIISEKFDQPPDILEFRDTAIMASMDYSCFFTIRDDNSENIRVRINENIPGMNEFQTDIDEELYYPAPFRGNFSVFPSESLSRPYPYKVVISADPKEYRSAAAQKSSMLWITDNAGFPAAPVALNKLLAFRNTIILGWQDLSDNEAGFVVERADSFFPEFIRIAALPANSTEYTDNNVIPNRDYYYRVKSVGTGGSSTSEVLEIREMDIITGINEPPEAELLVYPNPVDDQLVIVFKNRNRLPNALEVIDIAGKTWYRSNLPEGAGHDMTVTIPATGLSPGIYFLVFDQDMSSTIRKFVKR